MSHFLDKLEEIFVQEKESSYIKSDADYVEQQYLFSTKVCNCLTAQKHARLILYRSMERWLI